MYKSLQSGRAIASLLVLLFHLSGTISLDKYYGISWFSVPFSFGYSGVEFFFVLSGFIIFHVHKRDLGVSASLGHYAYKRIIRIYPVYIIIFSGVYILATMIPQLRHTMPQDFMILLKSLLLIPQNKELVGGTGAPVLIVAWSLQFEIMFYFAFAIGIFNKCLGVLLIVLFFIGYFLGLDSLAFPFPFIFSEYIVLFLFGIFLAWLITFPSIFVIKPLYLAIVGCGIYGVTAIDSILATDALKNSRIILYGVGCSFMILSMIIYETHGKIFLKNKFWQLLGGASYSLYLLHFPMVSILCKASIALGLKDFGVFGAFITFFISVIICILVAIYFHLLVELPIANKLKIMSSKRISIPL